MPPSNNNIYEAVPPQNNVAPSPQSFSDGEVPVPQTPESNNPPTPPLQKKKIFPKILIIPGIVFFLLFTVLLVVKLLGNNSREESSSITWWGFKDGSFVAEPLISEYKSLHPGVEIKYVEQSKEDYRERLSNVLQKGTGPDIFVFHNSWMPMFRSDLDTIPPSVMTAADFSRIFYPVIVSDLSYNNSIVGIPLEYDALTLYINQDIFDKAGKTPPKTWDELRSLAKELTIKDGKGALIQSGIALGRTENVDHWQEILALLMIQNGVDLKNPTGKNAEDALVFFTLFSSSDKVWDTTLPTSTQAFAAGKLAMYIAPGWRSLDIVKTNPDLKFRTVPIPQLPKTNSSEADITYASYWVNGVWAESQNKSLAWDFLNYISSPDSLQKIHEDEFKIQSFSEPYPRFEMASLLIDDPITGSIVRQALGARSWYLASHTFDGSTGINTQMSGHFADAINAVVISNKNITKVLEETSTGVDQILSQFRISKK